MIKHLDIAFKQIDGITLYLDLYLPENETNPPLIMWIHGGAWMFGDRKSPVMLWEVDRGYALASIEYRLTSPDIIFPAHIIDCKDALIYLKQNAAQYGYDASKIIVAGDSAGGHLSVLMGASSGQADWEPEGSDCSVQAVVDYYGPVSLGKEWADLSDPDSVVSQLLGADVLSMRGRARAAIADPITYINGTEPPFLILHGDKDPIVPYRQSVFLRNALEAAGVSVALHRVHGGDHGFAGVEINAVVDAFLDYHFKSN